jgi:hypothetical protein
MDKICRHGNKWTINEILSLQREYELLKLPIPKIALRHKRTTFAIMYKLKQECFIESWDEIKNIFDEDEFENDSVSSIDNDNNVSDYLEDENQHEEENNEQNDNETEPLTESDTSSDDDNLLNLAKRVWSLETTFGEISSMVKQMFNEIVTEKKNKEVPLSLYT